MTVDSRKGLLRRIGDLFWSAEISSRLAQEARDRAAGRVTTLSKGDDWLIEALGGGSKTKSGITISQSTALNISTVFACIRVISETCGMLPLILFERLKPRGRQRAEDHDLYETLHDEPNPEMTSQTFVETVTGHVASWGNGYAEIELNGYGKIKHLWPIPPNIVTPFRDEKDGKIKYRIWLKWEGRFITLPAESIFHIPGFSFDGLVGYSPVRLARESLGLTKATEEFGARFYEEGTHLGGFLQHPGELSDQAYNRLKEDIEEKKGLTHAHRLKILEEGMKYEQVGIPPNEAQFLDTRNFQVREICRWFRMKPHKVGDLQDANYSNIEHEGLDFRTDTMGPWFRRWSQAVRWKLLRGDEKRRYYAEFLDAALLRGDIKSRYEAYQVGRHSGWLTTNDIREIENLNPVGPEGDILTVQVSMVDLKDLLTADPAADDDDGSRSLESRDDIRRQVRSGARARLQLIKAYRKLFLNAAERIVGAEVKDVRRAARKHLQERDADEFEEWIRDFYERHPEIVSKRFAPVLESLSEALTPVAAEEIGEEEDEALRDAIHEIIDAYLERLAGWHSSSSRGQLIQVMRDAIDAGEDPLDAVEGRLNEWEEKRASKIADWRSKEAGGAIATETWAFLGIRKITWHASGASTCPYCLKLDGKTVGITQGFLEKDEELVPDDGKAPLKPATRIRHNPLHDGCDCWTTPVI